MSTDTVPLVGPWNLEAGWLWKYGAPAPAPPPPRYSVAPAAADDGTWGVLETVGIGSVIVCSGCTPALAARNAGFLNLFGPDAP